ncbi:hypothetical protein BDW42DRAFT_172734 [Aspergillus taichungensis]|uniref:Uncharacterized protein n=1 Tax=Aspergillus taichungensis TaxID=482145 RepID=A0A2J5HQJ6_9EURO|nr:hypothetical protein BDW42DRAFT_172734 [Aspergillus taichungensis]
MTPTNCEDKLQPLAVIGLSFKFPQDATSSESFWDMLVQGRCASTKFPSSRMTIDSHHHPDRDRLDTISPRGGHFISEDLGAFDAPFFGISGPEAEAMDPQQRLALETAYRAFESAGLPLEAIAGSKTSVIAGSFCDDYHMLQVKDPLEVSKHNVTGNARNMISNRLSWFFDLRGPSATVDTACSSSLIALDMACQSIWGGDATMGLAVGSNIMIAPEMTIGLDNLGLLSRDSRSYSFDEHANGYARGEGIGALVIKPLKDAVSDGDTIRAVIRSSSSNQDGKTPGILQPSKEAQMRLIQDTYQKAGLDMADTRYFEAHGTGTPIGDPIETRGIGSAFRKYRSKKEPLYVGSVKSNIGHLEGASGIAGVIKTILALEKGIIPPNSENLRRINPQIDEEFFSLKIPQQAVPWPTDGLRRASVSSFGFGGANCSIVLDDAYNSLRLRGMKDGKHKTTITPPQPETINGALDSQFVEKGDTSENCASPIDEKFEGHSNGKYEPTLLVWSSGDKDGIDRTRKSWETYLSNLTITNGKKKRYARNLAHTLASRRSHLKWRSFALADPNKSFKNLAGEFSPAIKSSSSPRVAFIFTGQGAQWYAMGRELIPRYEIFRNTLADAGQYLKTLGCEWDVLDEMRKPKPESKVNDPTYGQPLCTVVQIGLVDLLRSWNVVPSAVIGHSSGEIAAAYAAGAISKKYAMKVSYYRGLLAGRLGETSKKKGSMLAVGLSEADIRAYLNKIETSFGCLRLVIACVNSPQSLTISGETEQIEALHELLEEEQIFSRKLMVNVAYHSFQMEKIASAYEVAIGNFEAPLQRTGILMFSSVTGGLIHREELATPRYWVRNMVSPVLFSDALTSLSSQPANVPRKIDGSHRLFVTVSHIVEIGPHAALQGPCRDTLKAVRKDKEIVYIPSLRRHASAVNCVLECVGRLHCEGYPVDLAAVNSPAGTGQSEGFQVLADLPEYQFDHSKAYWHESRQSKGHRFRKTGRLDLLGIPDVNGNPMETHWRNIIRTSEIPWVQDHKINNTILYSAAGMVAMAIEAVKQLADSNRTIAGFIVKDCKFLSPIHIPTHALGIETNIHLKRVKDGKSDSSGWHDFRICCYDTDNWIENCTGSIQASYESNESGMDTNGRENAEWNASLIKAYHDASQSCATPVDTEKFYEELTGYGYQYGPAFAAITALSRNDASRNELVATIRTFVGTSAKDSQVVQPHTIHPTTLDAVIHMMTAMVMKVAGQEDSVAVPTQIENLWVSNTGGLSYPHAHGIKAYANSVGSTVTDSRYSMVAFDEGLTKCLLNLEGLRVTNIANSAERKSEVDFLADNLCHHVEWKPDIDLLNNAETNIFCASNEPQTNEPVDAFTELDFLVSVYVSKVSASALEKVKTTGSPHLIKYAEWIARQQDILSSGQSAFSSQEWRSRMEDASFMNDLHGRLEHGSKRGLLTSIVCKNLMQFISGEKNPVSVLFEGNLLQDTYFEMISNLPKIGQIVKYINALAHKYPAMKFIELGAGSGAMTDFCMKTLTTDASGQIKPSCYKQWDFTDLSSSFFPQAQHLFAAQGEKMRFMTLDIEQDPESQGFECGTYDVVVAFLVIHATENLSVSLSNARKLLRPGGKFLLFEITRLGAIRTTFVFGLFDGWWRGQETYRTMNPCVDEAKWDELLKEAGYSGCDVVIADYNDERCHECSMIVSTAVQEEPVRPSQPAVNIILNPLSTVQMQLADKLSGLLHNSGIDNLTQLTFQDCLTNQVSPDALTVCLLEIQDEFLYHMNELDFINLRELLSRTRNLLWINGGGGHQPNPKFRLIDGLFRVISDENQSTRLTILSLENTSTAEHQADQIFKIATSILGDINKHLDTEYVEIDGMLQVGRLVHAGSLNQEVATIKLPQRTETQTFGGDLPLRLEVGTPGLLNTLHFVEDKRVQVPLKPNEIEIRSKAVGLNFRDVLIALGRLNNNTLGGEFAGEVTRVGDECHKFKLGDRVVVYHPSHYANYVRVREDMAVIKIPNDWLSFVDAAAMPVTYGTAWLTLNRIARLQQGESVLIHSGAGGTGQAAIQIAQYLGATIFTTVSSETKKQFLVDQYHIPSEHIFSSRNTLFAKGIRRLTGNKGVDVVLNSLASDEFIASWESIAPYGRFVEIGKNDILSNSKLPMGQFEKNVSFSAFDLAAMSVDRPQLVISALEEVFDLIEEGKLSVPQSAQVYEVGEIEKAFRQMQSGKNMGKAVIELRDDDQVNAVIDTKPTYAFDPNATYVIAGGLGGLGRSIARWLVDRGARNLILLSRSGEKNPYARNFVAELREQGAIAVTPACDIADRASLAAVLYSCAKDMPSIKGCIQASMVVSNSHFEQLTHDSWRASTAPKAQGSWNLHELLPRGLDFFVLMSSVAGITGARGESGYASGNTFKDGLARYRIGIGEKAVSLDLGLFLSAGFFKENEDARKRFLANSVLHPITESDLHALLDIYCNPALTHIPIEKSQVVVGIQPKVREMGMNTTEWMQRPMFRHLAAHEPSLSSSSAANTPNSTNFAAVFATAKSLDDVTAILKQEMRSKLSRMLSVSGDEIDLDKPIHHYGVDSLAAVELRNWFGRELRADIAIFDILGGASIASVVALAVGKSDYRRG